MALRTLEELNRTFMAGSPVNDCKVEYEPITPLVITVEPPKKMKSQKTAGHESKAWYSESAQPDYPKKKYGLLTAMSDIIFSLAIVMILFIALIPNPNSGAPKTIFNYSCFTVLTPSMQDEIPQGSFILVKKIDPRKLKAGDNITYMADRGTSVTHKIVDIYDNYGNSGAMGFQTQGVNNANPDREIVYEANLIGKVVLVIPVAGAILANLGENIFLVFIIFILCVLLSFFLRGVFRKPVKRIRQNHTYVMKTESIPARRTRAE